MEVEVTVVSKEDNVLSQSIIYFPSSYLNHNNHDSIISPGIEMGRFVSIWMISNNSECLIVPALVLCMNCLEIQSTTPVISRNLYYSLMKSVGELTGVESTVSLVEKKLKIFVRTQLALISSTIPCFPVKTNLCLSAVSRFTPDLSLSYLVLLSTVLHGVIVSPYSLISIFHPQTQSRHYYSFSSSNSNSSSISDSSSISISNSNSNSACPSLFFQISSSTTSFSLSSAPPLTSFLNSTQLLQSISHQLYGMSTNPISLLISHFTSFFSSDSSSSDSCSVPSTPQIVSLPNFALLYGPPGTGKTQLALSLCKLSQIPYKHISCSDIFSLESSTDTPSDILACNNVKSIFKSFSGVIILDEIDVLISGGIRKQRSTYQVEEKVLNTLYHQFDKIQTNNNNNNNINNHSHSRVFIIGITNTSVKTLDQEVLYKFFNEVQIELSLPGEKNRVTIMKETWKRIGGSELEIDWSRIVKRTSGLTGGDLISLLYQVKVIINNNNNNNNNKNKKEDNSIVVLNNNDNNAQEIESLIYKTLTQIKPTFVFSSFKTDLHFSSSSSSSSSSSTRGVNDNGNDNENELYGVDDIKQFVRDNVISSFTELQQWKEIGIAPPTGLLIYGPSGTGKTSLVKWIVAQVPGLEALVIDSSSMISKTHGQSEKIVHKLFVRARHRQTCVLVMDQIEMLLPKPRGGGGAETNQSEERLKRMIEKEMDKIKMKSKPMSAAEAEVKQESQLLLQRVLVIGITNKIELMDERFLKPGGRFAVQVKMDLPSPHARQEILTQLLNKVKMPAATPADQHQHKVNELAGLKTQGWSGAELENLVREAGMIALRNNIDSDTITWNDLNQALLDLRK